MVFFILAKLHHRHRIFLPHPLLMRFSFRSYSFFAATGKYFPTSISCHTPNYSTTAPSLGAAIINEELLTIFIAAAEAGLFLGEEQAMTGAGGREVTSVRRGPFRASDALHTVLRVTAHCTLVVLTPFQLIPSRLTQPVAAPRKTKGECKMKTSGLVVERKTHGALGALRAAPKLDVHAYRMGSAWPSNAAAVLPIRTVRRDGSAAEGDPGRKRRWTGADAGAQRSHAHADGAPCCCAYTRRLGDGTEAAAAEGDDERDRMVFARSIEPVIALWMA
ncbi:hypothetical protein DFH08DRAFT_1042570 [Mycena albidolilacea]|uniref:Uncharacterized protein n=1 Tax=Mycena albidolilacea TaxID=1033008 RepID=A0AAD7AG81_9AGAR|nr:hypothetical protein DFH08DRAFT_1042570 [Mycena albidolilacea]